MQFLRSGLKGAALGAAAILPGVSAGVLAAVMGIYEPVIEALSGFFGDIKKNTKFLLPLVLGGAVGFFLVGGVIFMLMKNYENRALLLFSGVVLGGMPSLFKTANAGGFKKRYYLAAVIAFFASLFLAELSKIPIENHLLRYFAGGGAYAFGSVVPGVSASFLLINMGIYKDILLAGPGILLPFAAGVAVVGVLLIRIIAVLFKKYRGWAYYAAIGLLLASILAAFPPITLPVIDIPLFIGGLLVGFLFINP